MTTLQHIADLEADFAMLPGWEDRYAYIIDTGKSLEAYPEKFRTDDYKVKGCQSQVWLYAKLEDGKVMYFADSDASITKGIIAILVRIFSGHTPEEILATPLDFIERLGLMKNLSPNRANGLSSMLKQMLMDAMALRSMLAPPPPVVLEPAALRERAIEEIHTIFDPEIPVDIYELGLIYEVIVQNQTELRVIMTLTTPNCPSAQTLPAEVEQKLRAIPGVTDVKVEITFDPPWDKTMMSEAALFHIGLY